MKACGIVVEYNPFHNGHALHLLESKKQSGADIVIAVMSGNFLQRGEPALVSKWERTKMALLAGVDIVVELPYAFATQKADTFAYGAVTILDALQCDCLSFGSESGAIDEFFQTADFLNKKTEQYNQYIQDQIEKGYSYPKAVALAYQQLSPPEETLDLSKPNNILGIQYVKAIQQISSSMKAMTITRKSAQYHDEDLHIHEKIASATSIRKAIFSKTKDGLNDIQSYVPAATKEILQNYNDEFGDFHNWETYWPFLQYRLIQSSPDELREIYEVEEGIEHRLISAALNTNSFLEFMEKVKTKRYTWTRIQRICVHILNHVKKENMQKYMSKPTYIRLLGMTASGRKYLQQKKKKLTLPLISKLSSCKDESIALDIQASRIYALGSKQRMRLLKREYSQPPIIIDNERY